MDDNDNSTDGYGGSCDGGYGDSDTDSSYGGGYGDVDDDCDDTDSYGDDSNSYSDYGGYDDDGSNDNSSYSEADDGITDDDMAVSAYSSCEDTMDVFDADLDQTFSAPAYGDTDGWYESITEECEQAYDVVVDTLGSFMDMLTEGKKDTTMPPELDTTDLLANVEYQPETTLEPPQDIKTMPSEMPIENDTTDLLTDPEAEMVPTDIEKVSALDISVERAAESASGIYDIGTGVAQAGVGFGAIIASDGFAIVPASASVVDGVNNAGYGIGEILAAVYDNPDYAWNPLESGYEDVAENLGVSKQTADELYDMQEYFLSCNGVRKDLGKLAINEITKTNIAVDGIGVAKNLYTAMSDQYKGMMEQMEKRNDNASD